MISLNQSFEIFPKSILGNWYNQIGSQLQIVEISKDFNVKGFYTSTTGTKGELFELTGKISVNRTLPLYHKVTISFTVLWDTYGSITSWTGYFEKVNGTTYLNTKWHLVNPKQSIRFNSIMSSSDIFTRLNKS